MRIACAGAVALLAAGCSEHGTISVGVVAAPGSELLDRVDRVEATLTTSDGVAATTEARRDEDGALALELDLAADGRAVRLRLEGFDADDRAIARGESPVLPLTATDLEVSIYLGPPGELALAPVALDPARADVGVAPIAAGALLIGGRAGGELRGDVALYDAYHHALVAGADAPAVAGGIALSSPGAPLIYLFGGERAGGPSGALDRIDLRQLERAPAELGGDDGLARLDAAFAVLPGERYLVAGAIPAIVDGPAGTVAAIEGAPALDGGAAAVGDVVLFAGAGVEGGAVVYDGDSFAALPARPGLDRLDPTVLALPDGRGLILGGEIDGAPVGDALVFDPAAGALIEVADVIATPRLGAAIALAGGVIVVIGGVDAGGAPVATAEVIDTASLDRVAEITALARRDADAVLLPTGNLMIVGGVDAAGDATSAIELWTP